MPPLLLTILVDGDQVKEEHSIEPPKPLKPIQSRPKTSNKFGRGKRRDGDRKTTLTIYPILPNPQAADVGGITHYRPPTKAKSSAKRQLIRCLNMSEKKRQIAKDKIVVANKKIHRATNECKSLAVLAQERRQESNLALHHADCLMTGMRDEMTREVADAQQTSAKAIFEERQCHHGKACATHKKHAKQLALDQRDFDVVVKNLKQTSMCKSKKAKVVIRKKYQ